MDDRFNIRNLKPIELDNLHDLIHEYWNGNHIFLKSRELFHWQYEGFGLKKGEGLPALYDNGRLIGFRGVFPAEIRIARSAIKYDVEPIAIGSLYLVVPEYRGMKLGLALQQCTTSYYHNYMAIGSNLNTSSPIYKKSNYFIMDKMFRHVLPLSIGYEKLFIQNIDIKKIYIPTLLDANEIEPTDIPSDELENLWNNSIKDKGITALNKSKAFWNWRFKNAPIYNYLMFGGKGAGGCIVARIADLYNDKREKLTTKVFRILEFIPENSDVWDGEINYQFNHLINSVLRWAQMQGCDACEFYSTTNRFDNTLSAIGFMEVNYKSSEDSGTNIISNYEPCALGKLTNVSLSLENWHGEFNFNNTYFTLSDGDQDRPNILL